MARTIDVGIDTLPQVAWCWASGLIQVGDQVPADDADGSGPIKIAEGPKAILLSALESLALHGVRTSAGEFLVPGVPEELNQWAKGYALARWLFRCHQSSHRYPGVKFTMPLYGRR